MSDSENKSEQQPAPESLPWWDGETELTPENVQSFRYEHDMYWEREPHYFNVLSRDPGEYAFRYDHDTGVLVEVLAKGNSGRITQNLLLGIWRHLHHWYSIDAQHFCVIPGCKPGRAAAAQGSAAAAQGSASQQGFHVRQTDGGLHPSEPPSHEENKQSKRWAPDIVFEAEWLGVGASASVGEKIMRTKTGHLPISPQRFNGVQGRGKVKEYLDNTKTQVVFLAAPDVGCVYVFVKLGYAAYASNVQVASQDGEVRWAKGHRCYVPDKAGLPTPLFAWDIASDDDKAFVLHVEDPNAQDNIVAAEILRSEIKGGVHQAHANYPCAICRRSVPTSSLFVHTRVHLLRVEDVRKVLAEGVRWDETIDQEMLYRLISGGIAALSKASDDVKKELQDKLRQSYEQFQNDWVDTSDDDDDDDEDHDDEDHDDEDHDDGDGKKNGGKRKLGQTSSKNPKRRRTWAQRAHKERKRRIEKTKALIENTKALIAEKNDNIASKQHILKYEPNNAKLHQDLTKLREELKQLEQQLASEQAELQRLERELRQAQSDSPNNTSSTGPPNNTSSKD